MDQEFALRVETLAFVVLVVMVLVAVALGVR